MSQFSPEGEKRTLAEFIPIKKVYPAGRLDYDSEGLLLLTDDGALQHRITDPKNKWWKEYWVQVEGTPTASALEPLRKGILLKDGLTLPAQVELMETPDLWERIPPIRVRQSIPDAWIRLRIREGKNRQVRRMTAALGFPTLRLVRWAVGPYTLEGIAPGTFTQLKV